MEVFRNPSNVDMYCFLVIHVHVRDTGSVVQRNLGKHTRMMNIAVLLLLLFVFERFYG